MPFGHPGIAVLGDVKSGIGSPGAGSAFELLATSFISEGTGLSCSRKRDSHWGEVETALSLSSDATIKKFAAKRRFVVDQEDTPEKGTSGDD